MDLQAQILFLEELLDRDQEPRIAYAAATPEEKQAITDLVAVQDKENLDQILKYLDQYGWPTNSVYGVKAASAPFYIIQHSNRDIMEKYLPMLQQQVASGEASGRYAAMMQDRILMSYGKPQIYGTQAQMRGNNFYIWPIQDATHINEIRRNADFSKSIEEYAEAGGYIFDPSLEVKDFQG